MGRGVDDTFFVEYCLIVSTSAYNKSMCLVFLNLPWPDLVRTSRSPNFLISLILEVESRSTLDGGAGSISLFISPFFLHGSLSLTAVFYGSNSIVAGVSVTDSLTCDGDLLVVRLTWKWQLPPQFLSVVLLLFSSVVHVTFPIIPSFLLRLASAAVKPL